jgi:hypothetical protein
LTITYDPTYGFPQHIAYDNPELVDEDWAWRVTALDALE